MNNKEEALKLSQQKYLTIVTLEETTDGGSCYVAYHPELPNCMSQGATVEEAEANLAEATYMVIEHLLAHGLPVPEPRPIVEAMSGLPSLSQGKALAFRLTIPAVTAPV